MAKKRTSSKNVFTQLLGQNGLKIVLGLVASGSFVIAFGQEKISQWISLPSSSSSSSVCAEQFYKDIPPFIAKEALSKNTYPLCFNGFNVMYSGVSKTPLWVAEALTPQRLSQKIPRKDSFHEELKVPLAYRATLADYRASGYDRGHMAPNADMPTKAAQADSFSLANMVPQAPKNNQQVWRELEEATRAIVTKQKHDVYVVTGPTFTGKKLKTIGDNKVIVPTSVFKAIYIPKTGAIGAYYAPNDNSLKVKVVSICYLEEQLGMNIFPQLTEEQKRNIYKLPLNANSVKAHQEIPYGNWDAESQCAEDVSKDQLLALQKKFKSDSLSQSSNNSESSQSGMDQSTLDAIVKQLVEALLQYILQLLR
ncbi:DNA/RNA non-specific endonuclease [Acinetobacter faecalis]|uniref:DNA/RNA non-specific endonuclease n=1 Tax=Acinetobacter faecalis TaxID=2665161 RepID=UPI002A919F9A|nr:DNA/RNA non-specific endonuclease [Acinetobacter faecalis]MDY6468317.1 DNA/RNA non-specific endonuclease [Acinetobacter faecalis]